MRLLTCAQAVSQDLRKKQGESYSDETHLSAALDWLFYTQDVTDCDGSAAYYSLLTGWAGPYPETSGYIVPTLFDYAEYAEEPKARKRANRMASWLLTTQLDSGAFPGGTDPSDNSDPSVFNTGQILFGLVRAFQEGGEDQYLQAIKRAGAWLTDVQHPDGYWDRFDYRGEIHSYCSRVAWALLKTSAVTGDDSLKKSAVAHLNWVMSVQTETDWFEYAGFSPDEQPYLHTIAYTVRGLLESGILLTNDEMISTARATADQLLTQQQTGPLRGAYDQSWNASDFYCLTGNAQTALIWLRLYEWTEDERYLDAASTEISFLKRQQTLSGPDDIHGSFRGSHPVWERYMRLRYPNWASKFFSDAVMTSLRIQQREK